MTSSNPPISVIVPHYRDLIGLDRCLEALQKQSIPSEDFEVIVADNNSPEGEATISALINGRARLVVVTEKGAGPARNGGVDAARGQVLAFTDSDCVPDERWLAEGVAGLKPYDFVGGRVTVLVENLARMTPVEAFERVFAFDFKTYIIRKGFTGAGNMFCSKRMFEQVGGFRPAVSEDLEWSLRARGMGFRLGYAPGAIVGHPARQSWAELRAKWARVNRETYLLYRERRAGRLQWFARTLALPFSAIFHAPKVLMSDQLSTFRQRVSAIKVLVQIRLWRFLDALALLARDGAA